MLIQDRAQLRRAYVDAWQKARDNQPLEPLERQIAEVIRRHPEYQPLLEADEDMLDRDWLPEQGESNPFLHMGLHLAVLDQLTTDRPPGIRKCWQRMLKTCLGDVHEAEHRIMACIAEEMWKIQHDRRDFDAKAYLKCVKKQGGGGRARD
jgi:hypothetical protein